MSQGEVFTWRKKLPVSNFVNRGSNASADVAKKRRQEPVSQNDDLCQEDGSKVQKGLLWEDRKYLLGSRVEQDQIKQDQLLRGRIVWLLNGFQARSDRSSAAQIVKEGLMS